MLAEAAHVIHPSWRETLASEFKRDYMKSLDAFLSKKKEARVNIYPAQENIFRALSLDRERVKVVVLGQDPYHGEGQAVGLSFSVPEGAKKPPSLRNIFKELHDDVGCSIPESGDLTPWHSQGVLLINAILTVEASRAGSHQEKGWEIFTDQVLRSVNALQKPVVFVLWGRFAESKEALIDTKKHLVIKSAHPSPFAAHKGFFGSRPFSRANQFLEEAGFEPVRWCLEE